MHNYETKTVKLEENQITNITFENKKKKGKIQIIKVDKDDNEVYLEGVKFNILNSKGEVVDTVITNERGEVESKSLPIDEEYSVMETETQEMYLLTDEVQKVTLEENRITTLKFENEKKKGQIKIIKTSKDDNMITGEAKGTPLEGVEFEILDENNNFIENVMTDSKGIANSSKLPLGKYKVKEIKTGKWYILDEKYHDIKSVTVDIEDIKHVVNDKKLRHLYGLYIRLRKADLDDNIDSITILNKSIVNLLLINEIINCDWMINPNDEINNLDVLKKVKKLFNLLDQYEKETSLKRKTAIKAEIDLIKYYIETILNKDNLLKEEKNSIKFGKQFIKKKDRTI